MRILFRKVVTAHIKSSRKIVSIRIRKNDLIQYLGKPLYLFSNNDDCIYPGVVKAVACSSIGGISLNVEVSSFKGNGKVMYTGSLSELVKESIDVSVSYIKSNYKYFKISVTSKEEKLRHTLEVLCKDIGIIETNQIQKIKAKLPTNDVFYQGMEW